jgi:hypothetical protein
MNPFKAWGIIILVSGTWYLESCPLYSVLSAWCLHSFFKLVLGSMCLVTAVMVPWDLVVYLVHGAWYQWYPGSLYYLVTW